MTPVENLLFIILSDVLVIISKAKKISLIHTYAAHVWMQYSGNGDYIYATLQTDCSAIAEWWAAYSIVLQTPILI